MTTLSYRGQAVGAVGASTAVRPKLSLIGLLQTLVNRAFRVKVLAARQRSRKALGELDDRLLADIGVTREEASIEAAKGFWED